MRRAKNPLNSPVLVTGSPTQENKIIPGQVRSLFTHPERPLYVDLGTGKGEFLTKASRIHRDVNWIGIDSKTDHLFQALKKKKITPDSNVRYIWMDVNHLRKAFAKGEVDRFYINFCTPWDDINFPKRRLTYRRFLKMYRDLLSPDGDIIFKTDVFDLYEFSLVEFEETNWEVVEKSRDLHHSMWNSGNITTEWECYTASQGCPIYYAKIRPKS